MIERLDKALFLLLNSLHSPFWDSVMWTVSAKLTWVPLYLAIIILLVYLKGRKSIIYILMLILSVVITDQVSVHCFKEVFERLRPCHEPSLEGLVHIVNGKCGGRYGFVSSHAANSFGIATLSLLLVRHRAFTYTILLWAAVVSYSRIYLGVHYPGDIIGGALLGAATGWLLFLLTRYISARYLSEMEFFKSNKE